MYSITEQVVSWVGGMGYAASTYPPNNAPSEFVTVERTGGSVTDMVDHPLVAIQTWAATEARAEEMALDIRDEAIMGTLPDGVHRMDVNAGPYPFWDEYTKCPRYQVVFDVTCQLTE